MTKKRKSKLTPKHFGLGIIKISKVDSVTQVNRIRNRNKKNLEETIAELNPDTVKKT